MTEQTSTPKSRIPIFAIIFTILILLGGLWEYGEPSENIKDLITFFGRFHPLVVHMPIGFITAVLILQLVAFYSKNDIRVGIKVVLWFTMVSGILSAVIGTLLAIPGGYSEELLEKHRWLGLGTSVACIWLYVLFNSTHKRSNLLYTLLLIAGMGLVGGTGHLGGALTHGEGFLTAYLPAALGGKAKAEMMPPGTKEDAAIFGRVIQPVLENKCVSCHSESKNTGNFRMDSLAALHKGGNHGPALVEGSAEESLLLQRVHLPLEHKEHMPPKGKVQLNETEQDLITWWINQGAPARMSLEDELPSDGAVELIESALGFVVAPPKLDMLEWEQAVEASKEVVQNPDIRIRRIALDAPELSVYFSPSTNNIDEVITQLEPFKANITELDLGRTTFSIASAEKIGGFTNLKILNLNNTPLNDEGVAFFQDLRQLKKINLFSTQTTDAALESLKALPKLRQVITWNTDISWEAAQAFTDAKIDKTKKRKISSQIKELKATLNGLDVNVIGPINPKDLYQNPTPELFNSDTQKFGTLITEKAKLSLSSSYPNTPINPKLVQAEKNDTPYGFHTGNEKEAHLLLEFDALATLTAVSILNREDAAKERAAGLTLESSNDGKTWKAVHSFEGIEAAWHINLTDLKKEMRQGSYFRLILKGKNEYLHLKQVRFWGFKDKPQMKIAQFDADPAKFGFRINTEAKVTSSSSTVHEPKDKEKLLVQDEDNGRSFVIHTAGEPTPWVQFDFEKEITLGAMSIKNRTDAPERAVFLKVQALQKNNTWLPLFEAGDPLPMWNISFTDIKEDTRKSKSFRIILDNSLPQTLNLAQVRIWGKGLTMPDSPTKFDSDKAKYGERLNKEAYVTVSSTTVHDPENGLKLLVQDEENNLPFAFHTGNEMNAWLQLSYPQQIKVNAISIRNRLNVQERADGLTLQGSKDGIVWSSIWKADKVQRQWNEDLTKIPEAKRAVKYLRLIIDKPHPVTLHLGQVRVWGEKLSEKAPEGSREKFSSDEAKYGKSIGPKAKISYSTTSPNHHIKEADTKIVAEEGSDADFSFCTRMEINPWIEFSFDHVIELGALVIQNRAPTYYERCFGLQLERQDKDGNWIPMWRTGPILKVWNLDLSVLPAEQRRSSKFRLIDTHPDNMFLHFKHVRIWGKELAPVKITPPALLSDITGQGDYQYKNVANWGSVPGHEHIGHTNGDIVADKKGHIYVSTDGPNGLVKFKKDGTFVKSFPQHRRFHGLNINEENGKEYIYAAAMSYVAKLDLEGNIVQKIEGAAQAPENQWKKATAVAIAPNGDLFIADGYATSVIYKYDSKGNFIKKFGRKGKADGEFMISHGLAMDNRDPLNPMLLVCDRENGRLHHFDLEGNFKNIIINGLRQPCAAAVRGDLLLVAELGGRAVILDKQNKILSVLGDNPDLSQRANFGVPPAKWLPSIFTAPHGCSFDDEGNVYVQDWNRFGRARKFAHLKAKAKVAENIAPKAKLSASSEFNQRYNKGFAVNPRNQEWASKGEQTPWIQLTWDTPQTINRIIVSDRVIVHDHAKSLNITFSDGSSIDVTGLENNGNPKEVSFPAKTVTTAKFQITASAGPNIGLSEIKVFTAGE